MSTAAAFQRYAASFPFRTHGYLCLEDDSVVYNQNQPKSQILSLTKITSLAIRAFKEHPTHETQEALKIFRATLGEKQQGYLSDFLYDTVAIGKAIHQIDDVLESQKGLTGSEEAAFRLRFLSQLPRTLGVTHAPKNQTVTINWLNGETTTAIVKEWEIIEWLSKQVFRSKAVSTASGSDRWDTYAEIMTGAYKGDALLIKDDAEHHGTQELIALGAIVRTSSHNEKGQEIIGWNSDGSAIFKGFRYEDIKSLSKNEHHWSLEGDHIREVLFYAADMRKRKDGRLVCAKTARQVQHLIEAGKMKAKDIDLTKEHHFTAFQFEFAPDCEGVQYANWKYWYHKVYSSYLYRTMKRMGYENANVGPYGYGRTDSNPRVIE